MGVMREQARALRNCQQKSKRAHSSRREGGGRTKPKKKPRCLNVKATMGRDRGMLHKKGRASGE